MRVGVNFPGDRAWRDRTRRVPDQVVAAVIRATVRDVERYWKSNAGVPVRTGRLRASIRSQATGRSGSVRWRTEYAVFVAGRVAANARTLRVVNSRALRQRAERAAQQAINRLERLNA